MTNLSTGINKVINTVTLNHRRILSEAREGIGLYCLQAYIASPIFFAFQF